MNRAIPDADTVVFLAWLNTLTDLVVHNSELLKGKVVADPSDQSCAR